MNMLLKLLCQISPGCLCRCVSRKYICVIDALISMMVPFNNQNFSQRAAHGMESPCWSLPEFRHVLRISDSELIQFHHYHPENHVNMPDTRLSA